MGYAETRERHTHTKEFDCERECEGVRSAGNKTPIYMLFVICLSIALQSTRPLAMRPTYLFLFFY